MFLNESSLPSSQCIVGSHEENNIQCLQFFFQIYPVGDIIWFQRLSLINLKGQDYKQCLTPKPGPSVAGYFEPVLSRLLTLLQKGFMVKPFTFCKGQLR